MRNQFVTFLKLNHLYFRSYSKLLFLVWGHGVRSLVNREFVVLRSESWEDTLYVPIIDIPGFQTRDSPVHKSCILSLKIIHHI